MAPDAKRLFLAEPLGFCGGVRRALEMFETFAAEHPGVTVYVLHELVHNSTVTDSMRRRNAVFVDSLDDVPDGACILFGAHGISASIEEEARRRNLVYCDSVCPLVLKLQRNAADSPEDLPLILFGDAQHPEVRSVLGWARSRQVHVLSELKDIDSLPSMRKALFLCQTTRNQEQVRSLSELLKERIPGLVDKSKVCDAVSRRQNAVAELSPLCDLMLVVGSPHSSNGRRLLAIAREKCRRSAMVENGGEITEDLVGAARNVGISAATSTPDSAIGAVVAKFESFGFVRADGEKGPCHAG